MIIGFSKHGWEDYLYWQKHDTKILKRINALLEDISRKPHTPNGLGKPERLKENLHGYYSRRITSEHRLVYTFSGDFLVVAQCRYHY